ncbi:DUF4040 domain-containing protein [Planktothrix sp. FACHB-1355]|uniref:DUF4040 domain-containing protein n=1 Tax=Aerosakkonema funiforme FACHB-1375 TaxID=2949571 RepID=A0A926ZI24_9CYAN|nr:MULTISPECIES: DUF4040 domain-containing protein [Oscillatoriales]MBD2181356.1 DUF4040 domain-containing protein [Aerosakkonema funiforme FACHB-1375]MBD3562677.1 DUF4040 domain-containing protein [Planktothrix sp. FACHB-1355]
MNDSYVYAITALLPLAAFMVVLQVNPYDALVIRGILGAISAMLYAILGAPDVALTEALVGTMLAITLYAVAVRSSLVMRLGVLKDELMEGDRDRSFGEIMDELRSIFRKHYMRVELVPYMDREQLHRALMAKEVHTICATQLVDEDKEKQPYQTVTRLQRLYEIVQSELSTPATSLTYVSASNSGEKH